MFYPEINPKIPKLIKIIDAERETVRTDTKIKYLNPPGNYYFCPLFDKWEE